MVIRDVYCSDCGNVRPDVICNSCEQTQVILVCPVCDGPKPHLSVVNGGVRGSRYRFNDWSGCDFSGQVQTVSADAVHDDGQPTERPVQLADGSAPTVNATRAELRRDKRKFENAKRRGRNILRFFTSRASNA